MLYFLITTDELSIITIPSDCTELDNCTLAPFCPLGLQEDHMGCYQCACKDDVIIGELCKDYVIIGAFCKDYVIVGAFLLSLSLLVSYVKIMSLLVSFCVAMMSLLVSYVKMSLLLRNMVKCEKYRKVTHSWTIESTQLMFTHMQLIGIS